MENAGGWDRNLLINELAQGQELTRQLGTHLDQSPPPELCKSLLQSILSSWEKAISMAKSGDSDGERHATTGLTGGTESPQSGSGSPISDNSDIAFKDLERREMCKKRKTLPKWTSQVSVSSGSGLEGPLDDGYSWRKYGQKDILGAKFPRGYYRCTHRNTQGCPATKQVQRSDENPAIFDVTYRGKHTCSLHRPQLVQTPAAMEQEQHQNQGNNLILALHHNSEQQLLLNFRNSLKVKTEGLGNRDHQDSSSSFSFPSTPVGCVKSENHIFSSPSTLENHHFMGGFSPTFISPATSESNYFSVSPCTMSGFGGGSNIHALESDFTEIISAATSTTNSPMLDLDFVLEPVEFDPNFPYDASFFS